MKGFFASAVVGLLSLFSAVDALVSTKLSSLSRRDRCRIRYFSQPLTATHDATHEFPNTLSRRQWLLKIGPFAALTLYPLPAVSADEVDSVKMIRDAFQGVRDELFNSKGGVSTLSQFVDQQDYNNIMEFTKTYDQVLRKGKMGRAKKLLLSYLEDNESLKKRISERATQIANAITFDLIGLNRSSRSGQESVVDAKKYLEELQSDLLEFLALEDELLPS
jgi:hypothetical protein